MKNTGTLARLPFLLIFFFAAPFLFQEGLLSQNPSSSTLDFRKDHYLSLLKQPSASVIEKREALDSLSCYSLQEKDTVEACRYLFMKAGIYSDFGNAFDSYALCKEILQTLPLLSEPSLAKDTLLRQALLQAAISAQQSAFWDEALALCSDFIQQYPDISPVEAAQIHSTIGIVNMNLGNMPLSRKSHEQALRYEKENPDLFSFKLKVKLYNALAGWFYIKQQYDSSLHILHQLELYPARDILPIQFCYLYNNISLIHSTIGNYKIALDYLEKARKLVPRLSEANYINAHILRNFGWTYREQGNYPLSEEYYRQALSYAQKWDDKENLWLIYLEMGELYQKQGDIPMMRKYLLEGYQLKDQVQSQQNLQRSFLLNRDLELLKSRRQQEILEKNLELEKLGNEKKLILIIVFGTLLLLFLSASLWMIRQMLKSRKENKTLAENLSLNKQESHEELKKKEQDLAAATLSSAQKDESLKTLKGHCLELLKKDLNPEQQALVREMLQTINLCHYGSSWEEFRLRFETAYPHFFRNLEKQGSPLSKSEKYLASLLAIHISTKEISTMTRKSPRSVETYIYRLRKKLQIPPHIKTQDYFHALLSEAAGTED